MAIRKMVGFSKPQPGMLMTEFDDGTQMPIFDPDGQREAEIAEMVRLNNSGPDMRTAGLGPMSAGVSGGPPSPMQLPSVSSGRFAPDPSSTATDAAAPPVQAQPVSSEPVQQEPPQMVMLPGTPGQTRTSTRVGTTGMDPESREAVQDATQKQVGAQREANESAVDAEATQLEAQRAEAMHQLERRYVDYQRSRLAKETYDTEYEKALAERKEARERKVDGSEALAGNRRWLALVATLSASIANVGKAFLGQSMQPVTIVEDMIRNSVKDQLAQKQLDYEDAGERADVARREGMAAEIKARTALEQYYQNMSQVALDPAAKKRLDAMRKQNEANLAGLEAQAASETALKRTVETVSETTPGTPDRTMTLDQAVLESVGGQEAVNKWLDQDVGGESVRSTIVQLQTGLDTVRELKELARLNGGSIPTTDVIDFDRNETLRSLGARMGLQGKVDAEKANQLIQGMATSIARSYGGPITQADREGALLEIGRSTDGIMAALDRLNEKARKGIALTSSATFGDRGQRVVDSLMGITNRTPAIQTEGVEAF